MKNEWSRQIERSVCGIKPAGRWLLEHLLFLESWTEGGEAAEEVLVWNSLMLQEQWEEKLQ